MEKCHTKQQWIKWVEQFCCPFCCRMYWPWCDEWRWLVINESLNPFGSFLNGCKSKTKTKKEKDKRNLPQNNRQLIHALKAILLLIKIAPLRIQLVAKRILWFIDLWLFRSFHSLSLSIRLNQADFGTRVNSWEEKKKWKIIFNSKNPWRFAQNCGKKAF